MFITLFIEFFKRGVIDYIGKERNIYLNLFCWLKDMKRLQKQPPFLQRISIYLTAHSSQLIVNNDKGKT